MYVNITFSGTFFTNTSNFSIFVEQGTRTQSTSQLASMSTSSTGSPSPSVTLSKTQTRTGSRGTVLPSATRLNSEISVAVGSSASGALSIGAIAGIIVAIVLLVICMFLVAWIFFCRKKRDSQPPGKTIAPPPPLDESRVEVLSGAQDKFDSLPAPKVLALRPANAIITQVTGASKLAPQSSPTQVPAAPLMRLPRNSAPTNPSSKTQIGTSSPGAPIQPTTKSRYSVASVRNESVPFDATRKSVGVVAQTVSGLPNAGHGMSRPRPSNSSVVVDTSSAIPPRPLMLPPQARYSSASSAASPLTHPRSIASASIASRPSSAAATGMLSPMLDARSPQAIFNARAVDSNPVNARRSVVSTGNTRGGSASPIRRGQPRLSRGGVGF